MSFPAQSYIPQRPPIVMVDTILSSSDEFFVTEFLVRPENVFVQDGLFREAGMMENIAQTCAARVGFCSADQSVPIGVIGGINNFVLLRRPKVGEVLKTTISVVADMGSALVVDAHTEIDGEKAATCTMKVFITQN